MSEGRNGEAVVEGKFANEIMRIGDEAKSGSADYSTASEGVPAGCKKQPPQ